MFLLCAFDRTRHAANRLAFHGGSSATILKLARANFSRLNRLIFLRQCLQGSDHFNSQYGHSIGDRRSNVAPRRFSGRRAIVKNYHIASFVSAFRSHVRDHIMTSHSVHTVRIVVGHAERTSGQVVRLLYGSTDPHRHSIAAGNSRDVSTVLRRFIMDLLAAFQHLRFHAANHLRSDATALGGVACVLDLRVFGFINCRALMSAVSALGKRSIVGDKAYRYTGNDIRSKDVASKHWGTGALGYERDILCFVYSQRGWWLFTGGLSVFRGFVGSCPWGSATNVRFAGARDRLFRRPLQDEYNPTRPSAPRVFERQLNGLLCLQSGSHIQIYLPAFLRRRLTV